MPEPVGVEPTADGTGGSTHTVDPYITPPTSP